MQNPFRYIFTILFIVLIHSTIQAQYVGAGSSSYSYLDLPASARTMALGGSVVAVSSHDLGGALYNPALLSAETHMVLQASYTYLMPGSMYGSALYGHTFGSSSSKYGDEKPNRLMVGVQFVSNGKLYEATEQGYLTGAEYNLSDVAIYASYARQLGRMFRVGVTLKPIVSSYAGYTSFALGADIGGHFQTRDSALQVGVSLQNIGWQLRTYYPEQDREKLPLNLQVGLSYRVPKVPIRLGLTIHNLQSPRLDYDYTNRYTPELSEERESGHIGTADMIFRHTIWYVDVCPQSEKWWVTLSYNHRRRQECKLTDQKSIAGFALGAGVNIHGVRAGVAATQLVRNYFNISFTLGVRIDQLLTYSKDVRARKQKTATLSDEERARQKAEQKAKRDEERARRRAESERRQEEITRKLQGL